MQPRLFIMLRYSFRLAFASISSHRLLVSLAELEAEALKLSPADQARLLHRLASVLDASETSELTNDELEKRWSDFETSGAPGTEASVLRERARQRYGLS